MVDTNTRGAFLVSRAAARALIAAKTGGSIINVASVLGLRVAGRVAPYAASKAALIHLTRALALEWARYNIRVTPSRPVISRPISTNGEPVPAGRELLVDATAIATAK